MISRILARIRSLWRGVRRRSDVEAEMSEEFRLHVELRAHDLTRSGLSPAEALRRARLEFGSVELRKDEARAARGLHRIDALRFSWLDFKLGFRMLVRYPGLTVVSGAAMAFAIFIGAGTFELVSQMLHPTLPFPDGDAIVGLRYWNRGENEQWLPVAEDFRIWREELGTVESLGGFQTVGRDLALGEGPGEAVQLARISSIGFQITQVPPLLGRYLLEADEEPGAPRVVVLGHHLWKTRFASDTAVVGRRIRLGDAQATVVGVMPEDFGFPSGHTLWTPLRLEEFSGTADPGARINVFGRLAPGATIEEARAEASAIAVRLARTDPERYAYLQPEVLPYVESLFNARMGPGVRAAFYHLNIYAILFLVLVSSNVALLIFARAAARESEIAVRNALGASRARIVSQLFVEALVLGTLATVLGLALTGPALRQLYGELSAISGGDPFPLGFWIQPSLSPATVVYVVLLTLLGAVVAGVVPALKTTGRGLKARLQQAGPGAGGLQLGGIWTGVVVTQIAATVVFAGAAWIVGRQAVRNASVEPYFPAEQYIASRVAMDEESPGQRPDTTDEEFQRRYTTNLQELERRLARDPNVAGVTLVDRLPVRARGFGRIEVDGGGPAPLEATYREHQVRSDAVGLDFFDVFRRPALAGRAFDSRDLLHGANTVIVNASFVDEVLGGRSAIGRRIRYVNREGSREPGPWYEIVGVVQDLVADEMRAMTHVDPPKGRVFRPIDPSRVGNHPLHVVLHVPVGAETLAPTLRETAQAVSPELRVRAFTALDRIDDDIAAIWRLYAVLVLLVSAVALLLSLAGIYAVTSFAVARRRREIGVRIALGANAARVIAAIFRKPLAQVGVGVLLGCVLVGAMVWGLAEGRVTAKDGAMFITLGAGIVGVCGLACIGPALRALRIEPTEALREDG